MIRSHHTDLNLRLANSTDLATVLQIRHDAILALAPDRMTTDGATSSPS